MIIETLKMKNWGPYRGEHVLRLRPEIYAVVAADEENTERSNWIGKTWLVSAPLFVLYGVRPKSARLEDDWITDGESDGEVSLVLEGGVVVTRRRKRGATTRLSLKIGDEESKQKVAQAKIDEMIGMNSSEFVTSCFVAQKQIDRLLMMRPADRTEIVGGWLGLNRLMYAEELVRQKLSELSVKDVDLDRRGMSLLDRIHDLPDIVELNSEASALEEWLDTKNNELEGLESRLREFGVWQMHSDQNRKLQEIVARGSALRKKIEAAGEPNTDLLADLEATVRKQEIGLRDARVENDKIARLLTGEFDGKCPLIHAACPAADHVKTVGSKMTAHKKESDRRCAIMRDELGKSKMELKVVGDEIAVMISDEATLKRLREEAKALLLSRDYISEHGEPPNEAGMGAKLTELRALILEKGARQRDVAHKMEEHAKLVAARQQVNEEREKLQPQIMLMREAVEILGKSGAQREIAVAELAGIEVGANALLEDAEVDLRLGVRWGMEGQDLASSCFKCGAAFPASQKVKVCACGEPRGQHVIERLDIVPTSQSGAAEDLAGLAFQLAVAAWLRARRETDWSVVFADEPFAACDKANGRAVVARLNAMVRGRFSFSQGFVVAHDSELMEALPARVEIIRRVGGEMSVEVTS